MTRPDRIDPRGQLQARDLRARLGRFVSAGQPPLVVVTSRSPAGADGCLVGFHSQASIDPPLVVVWLSVVNRTYRIAREAAHLGVHLLGAHQHDLAEALGGHSGDEGDPFGGAPYVDGPYGVPLLDTPHRLIGRITGRVGIHGDHEGFALSPVWIDLRAESEPLRLPAAHDITPGHPA